MLKVQARPHSGWRGGLYGFIRRMGPPQISPASSSLKLNCAVESCHVRYSSCMSIVTPMLLTRILEDYALRPKGVHGVAHWARVLENGHRIADSVGADPDVIDLFAVFHDSRRVNDQRDDGHGRRGAQLAAQLRGQLFELDDRRFALLEYACQEHTSGLTDADPTVQVCWDADRLDLLRVGTRPRPGLLCTAAARSDDVLEWANHRAWTLAVPELVKGNWQLNITGGQ